jgi:SPOR domain
MSEQIVKRRPMIDMDEFERRLRKPLAPGQQENDLLAELARFVGGQEDPYKTVFDPLNRRPAGALRNATDKAETSGRGAQEPLIRGDFAAIEAGLLGAPRHGDEASLSEGIEPAGFEEAGEAEHWHYSDAPEHMSEPNAPFEEIRSRRPLYLMAAMIVAGIAGIGASFAFKGAVSSQGEIATIKAAEGPVKVATDAVAGNDVPNQDASILEGAPQQTPVAAVDKVEQPVDLSVPTALADGQANQPAAIAEATAADQASGAASVPVPPPPVQAQPQQLAEPQSIAALIEPKKVRTVSVRPDGTLLPNDAPPQQVAAPAVPVPAARPAAQAAKAATPKSAAHVATTPKPAVAGANGNPQTQRTSVAAKSAPVQVADASAPATAGAASPGTFSVQFAAPATEQEARNLQVQLMKKFGAEVPGFHPSIHKAEVGGKPVYRVRLGGLASRDEATALCQKVQSSGGNCFVAKN